MRFIERLCAAFFALCAIIECYWLLLQGIRAAGWVEPDAAGWAAWVQAVGTIAAIIGAFLIVRNQNNATRRLESKSKKSDEKRRFEIVNAVIAKPHAICTELKKGWGTDDADTVYGFNEHHLIDCKDSVQALPLFDVPDVELVIYLTMLPRALQELCDTFVQARSESKFPALVEHPAANDIPKKLDAVLELTKSARARCESQINDRSS